MVKHEIITAVLIDEAAQISFVELCQRHHISEDILLEFLEHGLLQNITKPNKNLVFEQDELHRILSAYRLHIDLEINTSGVILALELMDELEEAKEQLRILKRHLK